MSEMAKQLVSAIYRVTHLHKMELDEHCKHWPKVTVVISMITSALYNVTLSRADKHRLQQTFILDIFVSAGANLQFPEPAKVVGYSSRLTIPLKHICFSI